MTGKRVNGKREFTTLAALVLGLLGSALRAQDSGGGADAPLRERPPFELVLWLHGGPAHDEGFWARLRELGYTAVSVTGGEDPAVPGRYGFGFYRDQCAGKGELELREPEWQAWHQGYLENRDEAGLVRPACLADPAVPARVLAKLTAALEAALPHGPFAASIADEASSTSHFNPIDQCASPTFRAAFREALTTRCGGDITVLNARWGTAFADFAQVVPFSTAAIRRRELGVTTLPRNLAPWNDQLEFTDGLFVDLVGAALARAAEVAPGLPVGLTGMQPPSAFGGHDYRRLMRGQTFYETYDIGGARALARALAMPLAREFATLFPPAEDEPLQIIDARLAAFLSYGMAGVIVWSAGDVLADDGAPTAFGSRIAAAMMRSSQPAVAFAGARLEPSPICIVESPPSVRARWMLDSIPDRETWPKRLSSHEARVGTAIQTRASWVALLRDLGLQPDFVYAVDLGTRLGTAPPRLLVLADCLALADDQVRAIEAYAAAGGHVVVDQGAGVYDEALHLRSQGALDELFGLQARSLLAADWLVRDARGRDGARTASGLAIAERGLRGELGEPLALADVQLEKRHGEGRLTWLNLAVCEYAAIRLEPASFAAARELRSRVRQVVGAAGVEPPFFVRGEGLPACLERTVLRARDGRRLAVVRVAALDRPAVLEALAQDGDPEIELVFARPTTVIELRTGRELRAEPSCRLPLPPYDALFLELREDR